MHIHVRFVKGHLEYPIPRFVGLGFSGRLHWYQNFTGNLKLTDAYGQRLEQTSLMFHGQYIPVPCSPTLKESALGAEVVALACGRWIQQEMPEETNAAMLS